MRNLKIRTLDLEMTDAINSYFKEKMDSLDKFIDPDDESVECDARISKIAGNQSGDIFRAEVSIHTAGKNFGAVAEKDDLYASIDDVRDSVSRKMAEHKDKQKDLFKKGALKIKNLLRGFSNK